jgi:uncharacterized Zn finger protein
VNPDLRRKALAVLREGRLTVLNAQASWNVHTVIARVQSSRVGGPAYAIDLAGGNWTCTCSKGSDCAHIAATQLVTGHGTTRTEMAAS